MKQFFLATLLGSSIALCTSAMAADVDLKALEAAARAEGTVNSVGEKPAAARLASAASPNSTAVFVSATSSIPAPSEKRAAHSLIVRRPPV